MSQLATVLEMKRPVGRPQKQTKLRAWVNEHRPNQEETIAKELRVTPEYFSAVVSGSRRPSIAVALRIKEMTAGAIDLDAIYDPKDRLAA